MQSGNTATSTGKGSNMSELRSCAKHFGGLSAVVGLRLGGPEARL